MADEEQRAEQVDTLDAGFTAVADSTPVAAGPVDGGEKAPEAPVRAYGNPKTEKLLAGVGGKLAAAQKACEAAADAAAEAVRGEAAIAAKAIALAKKAADALQFHSDALENGVPDKKRRQVCSEQKKLIKALRDL